MSPDLERLLNALWERDTCEPKDRAGWKVTVERLIEDARSKLPGVTRDQFMDASFRDTKSSGAAAESRQLSRPRPDSISHEAGHPAQSPNL